MSRPIAPELLHSLALLVLRPDAVAGGHAAEVLEHLANAEQISPLALRVATLGGSGFDRLYRFKLPLFGDGIWLHHRIFEAGPAAVLVVGGEPGQHGSLCTRLNALKGASSPLEIRTPPSLRERFGRTSAFHAVLHVSEDEGALAYEASTMFDAHVLERVAERCGAAGSVRACALPLPLCRALVSPDPPRSASVFQHALSVKARIAATRVLAAPDNEDARGLWRITEQASAAMSGTYHDQRSVFVSFTAGEGPLIKAAIARAERRLPANLGALGVAEHAWARWRALDRECDDVRLLYASWCLSGTTAADPDMVDRMWAVLERNSVPVSAWQRTIILAGLRADLTGDTTLPGRSG